MKKLDWEKRWEYFSEDVKYIAQDENGAWMYHYKKPQIREIDGKLVWAASENGANGWTGHSEVPNENWKESLEERPKK